jgi:hypothetical protein
MGLSHQARTRAITAAACGFADRRDGAGWESITPLVDPLPRPSRIAALSKASGSGRSSAALDVAIAFDPTRRCGKLLRYPASCWPEVQTLPAVHSVLCSTVDCGTILRLFGAVGPRRQPARSCRSCGILHRLDEPFGIHPATGKLVQPAVLSDAARQKGDDSFPSRAKLTG